MLVKCPHCSREVDVLARAKIEPCFFCGKEFQIEPPRKAKAPPPLPNPDINPLPDPDPKPVSKKASSRDDEDALPAEPPRDRSGKYYLMNCLACARPLRVPTYEKGRILRCPSCRYFYLAPGKRRRRDDDGLPVSLRVSAHILVWPQRCACCLDYNDAGAVAAHTRVDWARVACALDNLRWGWYGYSALWAEGSVQQKGWEIPYCWECLDHIENRTDRGKKTCCNLDPAVLYDGWQGGFHLFRFFNWQYANAFICANANKVIG